MGTLLLSGFLRQVLAKRGEHWVVGRPHVGGHHAAVLIELIAILPLGGQIVQGVGIVFVVVKLLFRAIEEVLHPGGDLFVGLSRSLVCGNGPEITIS